jgi:hypothetical protein
MEEIELTEVVFVRNLVESIIVLVLHILLYYFICRFNTPPPRTDPNFGRIQEQFKVDNL